MGADPGRTPPPYELPPYWGAVPPGQARPTNGWTSVAPPVDTSPGAFSLLCALSLVAALGSGVAIAVEGALETSLAASAFAALLSGLSLYLTREQRPVNRWMAVVGLAAGLAPIALVVGFMMLLAALLSGY